jgi:transposase
MPPSVSQLVVYLDPVDTRWGPDRLRALCQEEIGMKPDAATGFIFTNRKKDRLLMYYVTENGDGVTLKKLERGAFLLPAPTPDGKRWVVMKAAMAARLFRA